MNIITIENVFLWFMIYSFFGWVYETIYCSIVERKFVYRGFLNGPYCPIYGFGALLDIFALGRIENPAALFLAGAVLTCSLEYFTGWLLETLFHAKWWDYTDMKFNIKGRVCLLGALAFGAFSVVLIKFIHPFLVWLLSDAPQLFISLLSSFLLIVLATDIFITVKGLESFENKLGVLTKGIKARKSRVFEYISDFSKKFNLQEKRMIMSFPKLSSVKYNDALSALKERLSPRRRRKNK